jgi:hypothetical protein
MTLAPGMRIADPVYYAADLYCHTVCFPGPARVPKAHFPNGMELEKLATHVSNPKIHLRQNGHILGQMTLIVPIPCLLGLQVCCKLHQLLTIHTSGNKYRLYLESVLRIRIRSVFLVEPGFRPFWSDLDPDLFGRIRIRRFGTGSGSGSGSEATKIYIFLPFLCKKIVVNT